MITLTVALSGVSREISGVRMVCLASWIFLSIIGCWSNGQENAIRPYAFARLIGSPRKKGHVSLFKQCYIAKDK